MGAKLQAKYKFSSLFAVPSYLEAGPSHVRAYLFPLSSRVHLDVRFLHDGDWLTFFSFRLHLFTVVFSLVREHRVLSSSFA